jgi:hypothetical protein
MTTFVLFWPMRVAPSLSPPTSDIAIVQSRLDLLKILVQREAIIKHTDPGERQPLTIILHQPFALFFNRLCREIEEQ